MIHSLVPEIDSAVTADSDLAKAVEALRRARSLHNPRLREADAALIGGRPELSEQLLSKFLARHPKDVGALHLMAETVLRFDRNEEAETLLAECIERSPDFDAARYTYANTLLKRNKPDAALAQTEILLGKDPRNPLFGSLRALILAQMGRYADALACHRRLVTDHPGVPEFWLNCGNALRSMGLYDECIEAFRRAIALSPSFGDAYLNLADLKTFRFAAGEIERIEALLARSDLPGPDRVSLHFAMGKACADLEFYGKSFEHFAKANAIRRLTINYDPESIATHVAVCKAVVTPALLQEQSGAGCVDPSPIFIVGMQRAGSTLVEQILVSHSAIEPTAELPDISLLAQHVGVQIAPEFGSDYPRVLARLDAPTLKALGESYIQSTRFRRKEGRAFFVDKMPYNFLHVGLIRLILPRAKIVDVRRHPLGCCFSNFTTNFKTGPLFAHRLSELGRAYANYVELMAHFDAVAPHAVHRLFYEDLVRDPEKEVRRLLDYLGLPFEEACLRFHTNMRPLDSVSSEQVRRPIFEDAVERWRRYEPWLGPLKGALGPVLETYPDVPSFPV